MKKLIKENIKKLSPSATLAVNELSKKFQADGKKIYRFGFGQSPFPVPKKIVEELKKNAHKKEYQQIQGLPKLREAVSSYLKRKKGLNFSIDDILIGPGSKELMFLLHLAFNGEIILPVPSWVSYFPQSIIGKNKYYLIETKRENNWFPSAQQLKETIKKTKNKNVMLFINSPNNPSGNICKNFEEISNICRKNNIIVLSDEIYSELSFDKNYSSISKFYPEKTIISSGLSKWCGAGGWRLGFFAIPKGLGEIKDSLKVLASESFSSVNAPIQFAAVEAYSSDNEDYLNSTVNILSKVGNFVYENLSSNKIRVNRPEGGFYLMPEFLTKTFKTSKEMCEDILKKTGVALLPGSDFGFKKNFLITRLSFTDFDGENFLNNTYSRKKLDNDDILKFAPNIVNGVQKLKKWTNSI